MGSFQDRVVLITGGSRGIGFSTAQAFLHSGAKVVICSRDLENLAKAQKELQKMGEVLALTCDVRDYSLVENVVDNVIKKYERIDILVNNAGVAWSGEFAKEYVGSIDDIIDVNVKGVLYMSRVVLPQMISQGEGVIVNLSSGAGRTGSPSIATYSASKFAVNGFTESLAGEVDDNGIRVYAVCAGAVATDMQKELSGGPYGMPPEEVAGQILELCGPNPPISSGECLEVFSF